MVIGLRVNWVAHRGASRWAPENTLAAFHLAVAKGFDWIEVDVQLTRDGVPVVCHDETLERTTNGHGLVAEHTAEELAQLDAGSWFSTQYAGERLPRLSQVLASDLQRIGLMIELKGGVSVEPVLEALTDYSGRYLLGSLDPKTFALLEKTVSSDLLIVGIESEAALETAFSSPDYRLAVDESLLSPAVMEVAQAEIWAWTVDDPLRASELLEMGVKGIITNGMEGA